jgi:hydroxypyruvate reductase
MTPAPELLRASFVAALAAAGAKQVLSAHLPARPRGRCLVVGAGKAAAAMAAAVEAAWTDVELDGLVITRYGHGAATERVRVIEAGHPVPDAAGAKAAQEILDRAAALGSDDLLLVLVSGGGSSLMSLPAAGLTMPDLQRLNRELLRCGAPIAEMNVVRKHLSAVSGGRLAQASAASVVALIISDVTGDDPSAIASGPCAPDPSTYQEALEIIERYGIEAPEAVLQHLRAGAEGLVEETPKPGAKLFERVRNIVIANPHASLLAAAAHIERDGVPCAVLGDTVTGEAREVAKVFAALVREVRRYGEPWQVPIALISGGECTVTLPARVVGPTRGGRCTEFLLALAIELGDADGVHALACDTDGIDGSEDNAGAVITPDTLLRARAHRIDARAHLENHDAWGFFSTLGDLVVTGPTLTNVNDYRVILVG